jgi:hypothetical protein
VSNCNACYKQNECNQYITLPLYAKFLATGVARILIKIHFINFAQAAWPDVFNCYAVDCLHYKMGSIQNSF